MRRLEFSDGKSNKFWEVEVQGTEVTTRWGKIGTAGQTKTKDLGTAAKALAHSEKQLKSKIKKGYAETGEPDAAPETVAPPPVAPAPTLPQVEPAVAVSEEGRVVWTDELRARVIPARRGGSPPKVKLAKLWQALGKDVAKVIKKGMSYGRVRNQGSDELHAAMAAFSEAEPQSIDVESQAQLAVLFGINDGYKAPIRRNTPDDLIRFWFAHAGAAFAVEALCRTMAFKRDTTPKVKESRDWELRVGGSSFNGDALPRPWIQLREGLATAPDYDEARAAAALIREDKSGVQWWVRRLALAFAFPEEPWAAEEVEVHCTGETPVNEPNYQGLLLHSLDDLDAARRLVAHKTVEDKVVATVRLDVKTLPTLVDRFGSGAVELLEQVDLNAKGPPQDAAARAEVLSLIESPAAAKAIADLARENGAVAGLALAYGQRVPTLLLPHLEGLQSIADAIAPSHPATKEAGKSAREPFEIRVRELSEDQLDETPRLLAPERRPAAEGSMDSALVQRNLEPPTTPKEAAGMVGNLRYGDGPRSGFEQAAWWLDRFGAEFALRTAIIACRSHLEAGVVAALAGQCEAVDVGDMSDLQKTVYLVLTGGDLKLETEAVLAGEGGSRALAMVAAGVADERLAARACEATHYEFHLYPEAASAIARMGGIAVASKLVELATAARDVDYFGVAADCRQVVDFAVSDEVAGAYTEDLKNWKRRARSWAYIERYSKICARVGGGEAQAHLAFFYPQLGLPEVDQRFPPTLLQPPKHWRKVKAPGFWAPATWPRIQHADGTELPADACEMLRTVLSKTVPAVTPRGFETYQPAPPVIVGLRERCTPESLGAFAKALVDAWLSAGAPAKSKWALIGAGWLGDDVVAEELTPMIRRWPGEGFHKRAVYGLSMLEALGTERALMLLYGISQKVKFAGIKDEARRQIEWIASQRGLSSEELADRLVPDLGLDASGQLTLDYGPRTFTVGFDERLVPYVLGPDSKRMKNLPKPAASDDADKAAASRKAWSALKKQAKDLAKIHLRRFEAAMVFERSWSQEDFHRYFVSHPLMRHVVGRLVWSAGVQFRVAEDGTYADLHDEAIALPEGARVSIPHARGLSDGTAWGRVLADYELIQPFDQVSRETWDVDVDTFVEGLQVEAKPLLSALLGAGWVKGGAGDGGAIDRLHRPVPGGSAILELEPGLWVDGIYESENQTLGRVRIPESCSVIGRSEIARDLNALR